MNSIVQWLLNCLSCVYLSNPSLQDCEQVLELSKGHSLIKPCPGLHPVQPIHSSDQHYSSCRSVQHVNEKFHWFCCAACDGMYVTMHVVCDGPPLPINVTDRGEMASATHCMIGFKPLQQFTAANERPDSSFSRTKQSISDPQLAEHAEKLSSLQTVSCSCSTISAALHCAPMQPFVLPHIPICAT